MLEKWNIRFYSIEDVKKIDRVIGKNGSMAVDELV
jgi:hypothetical protein